jgi:hypothetical protein
VVVAVSVGLLIYSSSGEGAGGGQKEETTTAVASVTCDYESNLSAGQCLPYGTSTMDNTWYKCFAPTRAAVDENTRCVSEDMGGN